MPVSHKHFLLVFKNCYFFVNVQYIYSQSKGHGFQKLLGGSTPKPSSFHITQYPHFLQVTIAATPSCQQNCRSHPHSWYPIAMALFTVKEITVWHAFGNCIFLIIVIKCYFSTIDTPMRMLWFILQWTKTVYLMNSTVSEDLRW